MMRSLYLLTAVVSLFPLSISAQHYVDSSGRVKIVVVADPYTDSRTGPEQLRGPELLLNGGLLEVLGNIGCDVASVSKIRMPAELEREYGEWNRASLTNRTLGRLIYQHDRNEYFIIGLLSGSKSLLGMLSGLQHLGPGRSPLKDSRGREIIGLPRLGEGRPLKVGLVWIDSRGAFNTADTTIDGDMGGMNVAVAAGLCNSTLRLQAGLDPPLSTKHILMAGLRDTNPYEQLNIDNSFIETLSTEDIRNLSGTVETLMEQLSGSTDVIYVHVDLSVLDPLEVPGHPRSVPGGPTSSELAACLRVMFRHRKVAAIGIASLHENAEEITYRAAYRLIEGAIEGIKGR